VASAGFDTVRVPSWLIMQVVLTETKLSWRWGVFRNFSCVVFSTKLGSAVTHCASNYECWCFWQLML